jgi:hypothetical protein
VLPFGQMLILGLLTTITLEILPFRAYAPFPEPLKCFNASWKPCPVRVFSTGRDSASIPQLCQNGDLSVLSSIEDKDKSRVGDSHVALVKMKCEVVRCRDATTSVFVAKFGGEVFAHLNVVGVKRHSGMPN